MADEQALTRQARAADGLMNAITGMGTTKDPRAYTKYQLGQAMDQASLTAAWRSSGLIRKIVSIPAFEMVREWREWKAEASEVSALAQEEARLGLRQKVRTLEVLRGRGGGAAILGMPGNPASPAPPTIKRGQLKYINIVSRWQLSFTAINDDATDPMFGEPVMWRMAQATGNSIDVHPSRVATFRADTTGSLADTSSIRSDQEAYWGESTISQVLQAVQDSDTARAAFATLLQKASRVRIGIPDLMDIVSNTGGDALVMQRLAALATAESIHNATIYDAGNGENNPGEEISDAIYTFGGAKDMINAYAEFVCAVSDIPATRLLGRAPEGLNSSGTSQQDDWNKMVRSKQELDLSPSLEPLDNRLKQSALGKPAEDVWYEWSPLDTPTQAEVAERFKVEMEAVTALQNTGTIPDEAFVKAVQSKMIEEGYLPGLEAALSEMSDEERFGIAQTRAPDDGDEINNEGDFGDG